MGMKPIIPNKEVYMSSNVDSSVIIQSSCENVPCPPPWFGEAALIAEHLRKQGVLAKISEHIRFTRRRFGYYEVIDFLAIQIALRGQFRAHPASLLRGGAALCLCLHGALWARPSAYTLDALALFGGAHTRASRGPEEPVSRRPGGKAPGAREADWGTGGSLWEVLARL
jgi:hypothetical protein